MVHPLIDRLEPSWLSCGAKLRLAVDTRHPFLCSLQCLPRDLPCLLLAARGPEFHPGEQDHGRGELVRYHPNARPAPRGARARPAADRACLSRLNFALSLTSPYVIPRPSLCARPGTDLQRRQRAAEPVGGNGRAVPHVPVAGQRLHDYPGPRGAYYGCSNNTLALRAVAQCLMIALADNRLAAPRVHARPPACPLTLYCYRSHPLFVSLGPVPTHAHPRHPHNSPLATLANPFHSLLLRQAGLNSSGRRAPRRAGHAG